MKVAAIVPAYNEADRLDSVLDALQQASLVNQTIVVNDGSTDDTYAVACRRQGVYALNLPQNLGKGGAMHAGASSTDADVIVFLDADLVGLTGEQVDSIIRPVIDRRLDMCIGVFRGGRKLTDLAQIVTPYISGQRAMLRQMFLEVPGIQAVRSGVEVAMTRYFRANGLKIGTITLVGCSHVMKEEKMGCARGFGARLRMYYEIGKILLDGRYFIAKHNGTVEGVLRLMRKKNL